MTFSFTPAVRRNTHILLALAGASGSGKTFSALELATGLAGETGRIAVIDTEAGRALHYADRFKFDHCELTPPFEPARYREAIEAAEAAGTPSSSSIRFRTNTPARAGCWKWLRPSCRSRT